MKKELKILIIANIALLISIIHYTFDLLTLCIDDTSKDALTDEQLNPPMASIQHSMSLLLNSYRKSFIKPTKQTISQNSG